MDMWLFIRAGIKVKPDWWKIPDIQNTILLSQM